MSGLASLTFSGVLVGRALKAGATSLTEPVNQFYEDRQGGVRDPVGNVWWIATRIEDVSPEELQKRARALMTK